MPFISNTLLFPLLILTLLSACSKLDLLNASINDDGYNSILDQAYAKKMRQQLNIHIPKKVKDNADVLIFYYGGRWQYGSKEEYKFVAEAFTSNGIITVLPDYRLYPNVDWPDFIRDGAMAYQWVYKNIAKFGGNPKRIFIMGYSAGAHIAAMVSFKPSLLNKKTPSPCGFIGLAGPYDFLPIQDADIKSVFSSAKNLQSTQPITFINKKSPSMLLLHGVDDTSVKLRNSVQLHARARQLKVHSEIKLYTNVNHVDLLLSLSSLFRNKSSALKDSVEFIQNTRCAAL